MKITLNYASLLQAKLNSDVEASEHSSFDEVSDYLKSILNKDFKGCYALVVEINEVTKGVGKTTLSEEIYSFIEMCKDSYNDTDCKIFVFEYESKEEADEFLEMYSELF